LSAQEKLDFHGIVLVIEDSALVANVVASMLEELGFSARTAKNAQDGLSIISHKEIDFVISDIELPGAMNGYRFALHLRKDRPEIPVILMTGNDARMADIDRDFILLRKPFGLDDLSGAIESATNSDQRTHRG